MSQLDDDLKEMIESGLKEEADNLKNVMKGIVHVRTGNLRDSITTEKSGDMEFTVGVDADKLESDSRNKNGYDYSLPYYYGRMNSSWVGHKFLEEATNSV